MRVLVIFIVTILLLGGCDPEAKLASGPDTFRLTNTTNQQTFEITVYSPDRPGNGLPVYFVLGGDPAEEKILDWVEAFQPDLILVSLMPVDGNPDSIWTRNLSEPSLTDNDLYDLISVDPAIANYETGDGDVFFSFLLNTVVPEIDQRYTTAGESHRGLIGYQMAAYFAIYALLQTDPLFEPEFNRFLVVSPPLFWANDFLIESEYAFSLICGYLPVRLYMAIGLDDTHFFDNPVLSFQQFSDSLVIRPYAEFEYRADLVSGASGPAVIDSAISNGFPFLLNERSDHVF